MFGKISTLVRKVSYTSLFVQHAFIWCFASCFSRPICTWSDCMSTLTLWQTTICCPLSARAAIDCEMSPTSMTTLSHSVINFYFAFTNSTSIPKLWDFCSSPHIPQPMRFEVAVGWWFSSLWSRPTLRPHGIFQVQILNWVAILLQWIFLAQGLNLSLPRCGWSPTLQNKWRKNMHSYGHMHTSLVSELRV